jgi:endonuclease YncB( thermonuclease family)
VWQTRLKLSLNIAAASIAMITNVAFSSPCSADTFEAKVVSVIDGDTLTVMHNGEKEKVILYGVDCPEMAQEFGSEARQFTDQCCYQKLVRLENHGKDGHGRTIADITLSDGTNLGQTLVARGLAWWSDKYAPNDTTLKNLFIAAKGEHRGLWGSPKPIPPWIFRNGERATQATIMPKQ